MILLIKLPFFSYHFVIHICTLINKITRLTARVVVGVQCSDTWEYYPRVFFLKFQNKTANKVDKYFGEEGEVK